MIEQNKALVLKINKEFIEGGNMDTFNETFADDFVIVYSKYVCVVLNL